MRTRDNNTDSKGTHDQRPRLKKTRAMMRWLTPWGMIQSIYRTSVKNHKISPETEIDDPRKTTAENISGLIVSALGMALGSYLFWNFGLSASTDASVFAGVDTRTDTNQAAITLIAFLVVVMMLLKFITHVGNVRQLRHNRFKARHGINDYGKTEPNPDDDEETQLIKKSPAVQGVLLLRYTAFRNFYWLAAVFSVFLILSPKNIQGLTAMAQSGGATTTDKMLVIVTSLILLSILVLKGVQANMDVKTIRRLGAKPNLLGYITLNNHPHTLIQITILGLVIALGGDAIADLISSSNTSLMVSTTLAAPARLGTFAVMIMYGVVIYRSASNFSSLETALEPSETGITPILAFRPIKLAPPSDDEPLKPVPPLNLIIAGLLGAALWVNASTGIIGLAVCLLLLMPLSLLLCIGNFHSELAEINNTSHQQTD